MKLNFSKGNEVSLFSRPGSTSVNANLFICVHLEDLRRVTIAFIKRAFGEFDKFHMK